MMESAPAQVIFLEDSLDEILSRIVPVSDNSGRFHVFPKSGVSIEWTRTHREGSAFKPGRYFLETSDSDVDAGKGLGKAFGALSKWIRETHPYRTEGRYPLFVGPSLSRLVDGGAARVVHANGTAIRLTSAAAFR